MTFLSPTMYFINFSYISGFYLGLKFWGESSSNTVCVCHVRHNHNFNICQYCMYNMAAGFLSGV